MYKGALLYSASDIVAIPSIYEPMGYVALEAMASARPVVASRTGGLSESIQDNVTGMLFEPGNSLELAKRLERLVADAELRAQLGMAARKAMEQWQPVRDTVEEWNKLYQHVAFSFGESFFPTPEVLETIRDKCSNSYYYFGDPVDVYPAAARGCEIAREVKSLHEEMLRLPENIPVDVALLRSIALELHRYLRREGKKVLFPVSALTEVMCDLSLAYLNREYRDSGIQLLAKQTQERLKHPWFKDVVEI